MVINNLLDAMRVEKIKRERANATGKLFVGMGIAFAVGAGVGVAAGVLFPAKSVKEIQIKMKTRAKKIAETIKDTVAQRAEVMKNGITHTTDGAHHAFKDIDRKIETVKKDLKDGGNDITQDMHGTAKNISKELNGAGK